jgi:acetyl esterase
VLGGLESHDDVCAEICDETGYDVVSVDYRLAPEHKHPAAFEDCLAAFLWAGEAFRRPVVVCGDSAGGNLAAAVAHHLRGSVHAPVGQLLIYPGLGGDPQAGSYLEHAHAPLLTRQDILFYQDIRIEVGTDEHDPRYAPLKDIRFDGLPPTVVVSAECDPLSDDGRLYCEQIRSAGGRAVWFNEKGLVHGYLRARHTVRRAAASFERITTELRMLGQRRWEH